MSPLLRQISSLYAKVARNPFGLASPSLRSPSLLSGSRNPSRTNYRSIKETFHNPNRSNGRANGSSAHASFPLAQPRRCPKETPHLHPSRRLLPSFNSERSLPKCRCLLNKADLQPLCRPVRLDLFAFPKISQSLKLSTTAAFSHMLKHLVLYQMKYH